MFKYQDGMPVEHFNVAKDRHNAMVDAVMRPRLTNMDAVKKGYEKRSAIMSEAKDKSRIALQNAISGKQR